MTLTVAKSIIEITQDSLVQGLGKEWPAALAPMAKDVYKRQVLLQHQPTI